MTKCVGIESFCIWFARKMTKCLGIFEGEEAFYCSTEGNATAFEEIPEGGGGI